MIAGATTHIPVAFNASVTFLAVSSTVDTMPLNTLCTGQT